MISLASTGDEPPYHIFRDEPEQELRGWLTPERVYRGRLMPPQRGRDVEGRPWSFANGVAHFINVIEGKEKLVMSAEHARHVPEIVLRSYESAPSGRALALTATLGRGS